MAVRGIGIERDVGEHADLRRRILDRLDRAADQIVRIERLARILGAKLGGVFGKSAMHGMPSSAATRARPANRSTSSGTRREASRSALRKPGLRRRTEAR